MIISAGPEALASVARELDDANPYVRFRAAGVLRDAAQQLPDGAPGLAESAAPLIRATADSEQSVAGLALDAVSKAVARPDVVKAIGDPALGQSTAQACIDAIDAMTAASSSGLINVARIAPALGPAAAPVRARLKAIAESDDPRIRGFARQALQMMDRPGPPSGPPR